MNCNRMLKKYSFLLFFVTALLAISCTNSTSDKTGNKSSDTSVQQKNTSLFETEDSETDIQNDPTQNGKKKRKKYKGNKSTADDSIQPDADHSAVPQKVLKVLEYVRKNGEAMDGYVGGRTFQNRERLLDTKDASGKKIVYREWDVNPKIQGKNRGTERLVTGSDGRAYFTDDHYQSFVEIKNKN